MADDPVDPQSPKYSPKSSPYSMTGLGENLTWKLTSTSTSPSSPPLAEESPDAARRRQEKLDAEKGRTAFAIAHSVGIDGSLNPVLAQPTLPSLDGADPDAVPVMRKMAGEGEPLGKRVVEEVKEVGRCVKDVVGKVVSGVGKGEGDEAQISDSTRTEAEADGYDGSSEKASATDHPDDTTDDHSGFKSGSVTKDVGGGDAATTRSRPSSSTPSGAVSDSGDDGSSRPSDHRDLASLN